MNTKWGLVVSKKEMTRLWIDWKMTPVTIVEILPQKILRYKLADKDWYTAAVVWVEETDLKKEKWHKKTYAMMTEFKVDEWFVSAHEAGSVLDNWLLEGIGMVTVRGLSKGKGYQWAIKRFHLQWWPKTHGSKFHRHVGSMGNRKPRRTMKNHPHAGHMGDEITTLKKISILDHISRDGEQLLTIKGSLPGTKNWLLKFIIE